MSQDPFIILGVDRNTVNQSELHDAYVALRAKYAEDRFLEGEAGANAARKISEIDQAYNDALDILKSTNTFSGTVSYEEIKKEIRAKNLNEAQRLLDTITTRDAEWHFLQSVIYYKKGWVDESRAQLETAVRLDPGNEKYREELNKMNANTRPNYGYNQHNRSYGYTEQDNRSYHQQRPVNSGDGICNLCSTLCALDCCCECMGGDCIPCC